MAGIYRKNPTFQCNPAPNARKNPPSCRTTPPSLPPGRQPRYSPAVHIQTHILSGWLLANLLPRATPRERAFCILAAALPDIDGLGILISQDLYWDLHHRLGHNVFFFAAVAGVHAAFSSHRLSLFLACFALGWLHFVLDYLGSGPGWYLHPWWPASDAGVRWEHAWPFYSWQNIGAFLAMLAATLWIALGARRTPLEWVMPRLDAQLVAFLRRLAGVRPRQPAGGPGS